MIRQAILTAATWIVVLVMWAYIGVGLARQFDPEQLRPHPSYTNEYVERLEREKIYYERQAHWYQNGWENLTKILGE